MKPSPLLRILNCLGGADCRPRRSGSGYSARCPAHDDRSPSLSVSEGDDGRALVHCQAGCGTEDVLAALKLSPADLFVPKTTNSWTEIFATYDYTDERGELLFQVVRYASKAFKQRRPDGEGGWLWNLKGVPRVLYRLPEVVEAEAGGRTIFVAEGEKDVDALRAAGEVATCNPMGAGKWRPEHAKALYRAAEVVVVADADEPGRAHARQVADSLAGHVEKVSIVESRHGKDAAEHLGVGHTVEELRASNRTQLEETATDDSESGTDISAHFSETHAVFTKWLGASYDVQALDAVLAAAAAVEFPGDPPWLLIVGGSGAAKTETLMPLIGAGGEVVSTISGEAALLSGTPKKEQASDANGGVLRKIGPSGLLVIKDVTSILSMNRDTRAQVLAALREIYDGRWYRDVGSDGGRRLTWQGRLVVVGAVTTAWDQAHAVISSMGDRFVLVRIDSAENRREAGLQALRNVDHEPAMRAELADVVGRLIKAARRHTAELIEVEMLAVLDRADVVTRARTGVERDYSGNVICAHAPEMPTRFAKQLAQLMRGGMAIGMALTDAFEMMLRCAADSVPPLRLAVLGDVVDHPLSPTSDVVMRLQLPRRTVDRVLQELHLLGLLRVDQVPRGTGVRWLYTLDASVDAEVVRSLAKVRRNVSTPAQER